MFSKSISKVTSNGKQRKANVSVNRLLSESDQFRQRPELRVMQQESYSTVFGQCSTILMIVICLAMFVTSLYSILNHATPSISQTQEVLIDTSPYPLNKDNFTLVVVIRDVYGNPIPDLDRYLLFQVQSCLLNQTTSGWLHNNNPQVSFLQKDRFQNYSMQQCDMETSFQSHIQKEFFSERNLSELYCINSTEWDQNPISLQGTQEARVYQFLQVLTRACQNTSSFSNCQTPENIKTKLNSITYIFIIFGTLSQVANFDEPFKNYIASKHTILSIETSKTVYQNLVINEVRTDTGIIFADTQTESMLGFSDIETDSNPYNGLALCNHMIIITGVKYSYYRSYEKLQNILGQVGGLWQIVFFIFGIFLHKIVKKMLYLHMAHDLFDLNPNEKYTQKENLDLEEQRINKIINRDQPMKINRISLLKFICGIESPEKYELAHQKIQDSFDIQYILSKLNEIDQLKDIILTKEQNQLFQFMVKPALENKDIESNGEIMQATRSAYFKIKEDWNQTDQNLFNKLDPNLINTLQQSYRDPQLSPLNSAQPILTNLVYDEVINLESEAQRPRARK